MPELFFSIPDSAIFLWLAIGAGITNYVDMCARDAGVPPLRWREWALASITWPVSIVNILRVWARS